MFKSCVLISLCLGHIAAGACPVLTGKFYCRTNPKFSITVEQKADGAYSIEESSSVRATPASRELIPDGQMRDLNFSSGKGTYKATCDGPSLIIEAHTPDGNVFTDRYYLERSAIVRLRHAEKQNTNSTLVCGPYDR